MKLTKILSIIIILATHNFTFANEIALTFDDLPSNKDEIAANQRQINERILQALAKFNAPAIGFVNEGNLYTSSNEVSEKIAILKLWIENGHSLGNHTYSHKALSTLNIEEFKKDTLKGSEISKKLMEEAGITYQYFRHPYLDTGRKPEIRNAFEEFLKNESYIVAPVTVDTDDWKFNDQLLKHPTKQKEIIQAYLDHTKKKIEFYEEASKKIFGYNIKHIWLLHVNLLNSYAMEDLLQLAKNMNYKFISLDDALKDKAYSTTDNYYERFGTSWLYRWDFTKGKVVDWSKDPEPGNNPFIKNTSLKLFDKKRKQKILVETYVSEESHGQAIAGIKKLPVVILSHGDVLKNTQYSFMANSLAHQGYFVASVQHDLLSLKQEQSIHKPIWEHGVHNILFVIKELAKSSPELDMQKITVIGHSNGGDISILFASLYPHLVSKIISLDSLRAPFPRSGKIPLLSLRALDTVAEQDVIPSKRIQKRLNIKIISLNAKHKEMSDLGPEDVKDEIIKHISSFLKG